MNPQAFGRIGVLGLLAAGLVAGAWAQPGRLLDDAVAKVSAGKGLTPAERDECHQQFVAYWEELSRNNHASNLNQLPQEKEATHYVTAIKMSVIDPERHGGWLFRHSRRRACYPVLRKRLADAPTPVLMAALIIPALDNMDVDQAVTTYRALAGRDTFWARYILETIQAHYPNNQNRRTFLAAVAAPD